MKRPAIWFDCVHRVSTRDQGELSLDSQELAVQRVLTKQGFHCPPHYVVKVDWTSLAQHPGQPGQLHLVENYWEAAGVMAAMQAGIDPKAVRRPLERAIVEKPTGATPGIDEILTAPLRPF